MQYVSNVFLDFHDPTIEDAFQTQTVVDGEPGTIDILDTAGQVNIINLLEIENKPWLTKTRRKKIHEKPIESHILCFSSFFSQDGTHSTLNEQYLKHGGEAFIGVYSINDAASYSRLRHQIQLLKRLRNFEKIPLVIVANKLDLFNERVVSTMDGIALAREFDCPFYEASAANRINVEEAFNGLIRQVRKMEADANDDCNNLKKPKLKRFRKYVCKKIQSHIVIWCERRYTKRENTSELKEVVFWNAHMHTWKTLLTRAISARRVDMRTHEIRTLT